MKKFKTIDCWMSILLIAGFLIASIIRLDLTFIVGYFVVGGWQLISILVHFFNKAFVEKGEARDGYQKYVFLFIIIVAILFPLALLFKIVAIPLLIVLFILLFCAPFMAVYYTYLCYHETFVKMKRPMDLLK